jgi:hypothetical protein
VVVAVRGRGAVPEEQLDDPEVPVPRCEMERGGAEAVVGIGTGPLLQKLRDTLGLPLARGGAERSIAENGALLGRRHVRIIKPCLTYGAFRTMIALPGKELLP